MPKDYLKFAKDLKKYTSAKLEFIKPEESKYKEYIQPRESVFGTYPIGKLLDIEIFFLHYKSEEEALEKWTRRVQRINFDNIILKFNDQNGCEFEDVVAFDNLNYENKICFSVYDDKNLKSNFYIKEYKEKGFVVSDMIISNKYIKMNKYLNKISE